MLVKKCSQGVGVVGTDNFCENVRVGMNRAIKKGALNDQIRRKGM